MITAQLIRIGNEIIEPPENVIILGFDLMANKCLLQREDGKIEVFDFSDVVLLSNIKITKLSNLSTLGPI